MGKIESYQPTSAPYVDGPDREPYIGRPCRIIRVQDDAAARFGPRWVAEVAMLDSGEVIALGFAKNAWRDRVMGAVSASLDDGGELDPVILFRDEAHKGANNQAPWSFRSATDAEIEAAAAEHDDLGDELAEPSEPAKGKGK